MSQPMQLTAREHAKPCMIEVLEVKKTRGSTANGSCIDSTICDQTSNGVAPASPKIAIKETAGGDGQRPGDQPTLPPRYLPVQKALHYNLACVASAWQVPRGVSDWFLREPLDKQTVLTQHTCKHTATRQAHTHTHAQQPAKVPVRVLCWPLARRATAKSTDDSCSPRMCDSMT